MPQDRGLTPNLQRQLERPSPERGTGNATIEDVTYLAALLLLLASFTQASSFQSDPPHKCDDCEGWNKPREPFKIFGNTYFVGTDGLSAILITGDAGLVLLDGGLEQSAARIDANIRKLGFRTEDVKLIVNSHGHFDHAGGIAALQRASGATVAASPPARVRCNAVRTPPTIRSTVSARSSMATRRSRTSR